MNRAIIIVALLSTTSTQAFAQDVVNRPQAEEPEILVTANKAASAESVRSIPLAISAFSEETLIRAHINSITELGRVPGVQFNDPGGVPGYANFFIRGVGLVGSVRSLEPTVGISVDGMPQEYIIGTILPLEDAATVEVLRGPQGVLNGRNSPGGAVNVRTKRPTATFQGEARARIGEGGRFDAYALVSGPIAGDTVLGKISVSYKHSNGLYKTDPGTFVPAPFNPSGTNPGIDYRETRENSLAIRPALEFNPSENFKITLLGEYLRQTGGGAASRITNNVPNLLQFWGWTPSAKTDAISHNGTSYHLLQNYRAIAELEYTTDFGVFTSLSGYRKVTYNLQGDVDGSPFTIFHFPEDGMIDDSKQFTEEARFASTFSDVFRMTVGGFYSRMEYFSSERREMSNALVTSSNINTPRALRGSSTQTGNSKAIFYNVDYEVVPTLTLSHGGRYTKDNKNFSTTPLGTCSNGSVNFATCGTTSFGGIASWNNFSPKFSVTFKPNDDLTLYGSWTKGYRSGAFNGRASSLAAIGPARPETIQQWEVGVKTSLLDRRITFNLATFTSKYNDIQRTALVNAIQTLSNAARARLSGVEVEAVIRPVTGLSFTGNVSYIDAKFLEFIGLVGFTPEKAKLLKFEQLPAWTTFAEAAYRLPVANFLGSDGEASARVSYTYKSDYFADTLNLAPVKGYGILDGAIGYKVGNISASIYGKNLTNQFYAGQTAVFNFGGAPGNLGIVAFGAPPREIGVEFGVDF